MKISALFLSTILLPTYGLAANQDVKSSIDRVTIFRDRAEIERLAHVDLNGGSNVLTFDAIPQSLNPDSLKVSGIGSADFQLISVQHRTRYFEENRTAEARVVEIEIEELERKTKTLNRRKSRLERESALLNEIKLDQETPASEHVLTPRTSKEITEILTLVSNTGAKLDIEIDTVENEIGLMADKIAVLQTRLTQFGSAKKSESVVEVKLNAKAGGKADVRLAYQVSGASWTPDYNLQRKATKGNQEFSLETFSNISQSTGENWDNVEVVLSTARPQLGIARPQVSPVVLDLVQKMIANENLRNYPAAVASINKFKSSLEAGAIMDLKEDRGDLGRILEKEEQAETLDGEVVTYRVKSRLSLRSDGASERVKIAENKLDGSLLNIAVPARAPYVFMEGRFKNGKQPLLAGIVNVFSNGNYVGKQNLRHIPASKDFQLSLGISNDITVERERAKDFEDDAGLIRSVRRLTKEYIIRASNLSEGEQKLVILEPRPVSQHEKITTEFVEKTIKSLDIKDPARIDKTTGIAEWQVALAPGKTQEVVYQTVVEFAADQSVSGIEQL